MIRRPAIVALTALLAGSLALAPALPAAAEGMPTTTKFVGAASQEISFGSAWFVKIQVRQAEYYSPLDSADGTVDVFAKGIAEPLGDDLPLTRDGIAFFSQPAGNPLLAAGSYELSAVFTPASGTSNATSRTTKTATLVITPLAVATSFSIVDDPARYPVPTVEARVSGAYVDATGQAPVGSWAIVVTDSAGAEVFTSTAAQSADSSIPTPIAVTSGTEPGETYTVNAVFTPAETIAGGLTVGASEPVEFTTTPAGAFDGAVAPVSLPWWIIITLIALVVVLAGAVVALLVIGARRTAPAGDPRADGEPLPALAPPAVDSREVVSDEGTEFFDHERPAFGTETITPQPGAVPVPPAEDRKSWSLGDERD